MKDKKWGSKVPVLQEQDFHNIEDLSKEQPEELKPRNIIGCDPGKRNLVYMVDENGKKLQYTAPQRKRESYGKRNQRILLVEKKRNNVIEKETKLSFQNSKSVNIIIYFNFIRLVFLPFPPITVCFVLSKTRVRSFSQSSIIL